MRALRVVLPAILLALGACTQPSQPTQPTTSAVPVPADAVPAVVERVVDGDTLIADVGGARERIRLLRIDTPELARDGDPAECLAETATATLDALLPAGAPIAVATDVEVRDRFGRLLAHVWVDGTWVNGAMLDAGVAEVVTFPPNVAYDDEVRAAVRRARAAGTGLWDPSTC